MIDYIISSTITYYEKTLPILIYSLFESGISPENIRIYVGGSNITKIENYLGCYLKYVKHNSFDYTSIIEYCDEYDTKNDRFFLLHDTCKVDKTFKEKVENFDPNYDTMYLIDRFVGICNFGLYKKSILEYNKPQIKSLINCSKDTAVNVEGFLFKLNSVTKKVYDNQELVEIDSNIYDGVVRKCEYYKHIGLYKYKANWGQSNKWVIGV